MHKRDLPSLDLLKGFEAAARNLSFTKAAAELFVTQSAISRQVKALEDQLGISLFRRRHRELRLTEQGQTLYKTSGEVLRLLRDVAGRPVPHSPPPLTRPGIIRLGTPQFRTPDPGTPRTPTSPLPSSS